MYTLQETIQEMQIECDKLGQELLGPTYEDCFVSNGFITLSEDCGHEFDSDEYLFDSDGNLL